MDPDNFNKVKGALLADLGASRSALTHLRALEELYTTTQTGDEEIRQLLRKWRCESHLDGAYNIRVEKILRDLTIFQTLEVPLFIDNYGKKTIMTQYGNTEDIDIDLKTPIVHVTHQEQKDEIVRNGFKPSNNKNIIEGIWFSPKDQLGDPQTSVYGSWAFETTLEELGVSGIRQGEIVAYKDEVNFILYASDTPQNHVQKATDAALKEVMNNPLAYGHVSIFVPSRFMLDAAFGPPVKISHWDFCVKQKRSMQKKQCPEKERPNLFRPDDEETQ